MTELLKKFHPFDQSKMDRMPLGAVAMMIDGLHLEEKYGGALYGKAMNLLKQLRDQYDEILSTFDVLVLPTTPYPANTHPASNTSVLEKMVKGEGMIVNCAPFNSTGHPALSLPVGFVAASDNADIKLPVGMQIVGRAFDENSVYKVAYAWEQAYDWKTM